MSDNFLLKPDGVGFTLSFPGVTGDISPRVDGKEFMGIIGEIKTIKQQDHMIYQTQ